jgi:hypothetical protein
VIRATGADQVVVVTDDALASTPVIATLTDGCEIVFADPDNGIRSTGHMAPSYRTKAVKYAYLDELAAFAAQGLSLVVYHHADRGASVEVQARRQLADIAREVPIEPVAQ